MDDRPRVKGGGYSCKEGALWHFFGPNVRAAFPSAVDFSFKCLSTCCPYVPLLLVMHEHPSISAIHVLQLYSWRKQVRAKKAYTRHVRAHLAHCNLDGCTLPRSRKLLVLSSRGKSGFGNQFTLSIRMHCAPDTVPGTSQWFDRDQYIVTRQPLSESCCGRGWTF